jgi:phosphoribosylformimino-5-aminoimidazole carboxamide ribotide isomerase
MIIIPAIDIRGGRCVRLLRGEPGTESVYGNDPVQMALHWREEGADWIHVVDLDAAFGTGGNRRIIRDIVGHVDARVQIGGGVRRISDFEELIAAGAERVVFGTAAVEQPSLVEEALRIAPARVVVGVDELNGRVAIRGWKERSNRNPVDFARRWLEVGVELFVHTDIERDGSLEGPSTRAIHEFAKQTKSRVIASGGIGKLADIRRLQVLEGDGVEAAIVGKALYEGAFTFREARALC